jgi:hypothetical protein
MKSRTILLGAVAIALAGWSVTPHSASAQQPQIAELSPSDVTAGGPALDLVIRGAGFVPGVSRVQFNGAQIPGASVSSTEIRVRVPSDYFSRDPFVTESNFRDGVYSAAVIVLNGPESGAPMAVKTIRIVKPGVAAVPVFNAPIITAVSPTPADLGGTLTVTGDNFRPANASNLPDELRVELVAPTGARFQAQVSTRNKTQLQLGLTDIPQGSYSLEIWVMNTGREGRAVAPTTVVVGTPTVFGTPTISSVGPTPVTTRGATIYLVGTNFGENVEVTLVPPSGAGAEQRLQRAPNQTRSADRIVAQLPALTYPGTYTLRVANQGGSAVEHPLQIQHPEQAQFDRSAQAGPRGSARGGRPDRGRPSSSPPAPRFEVALTHVVNTPDGPRVKCLVPSGNETGTAVVLRGCHDGGAQFRLVNGYVATANGKCLDYGGSGGPIHLMDCKPGMPGGTSQQWYLHGQSGQFKLQNALDPNICMDVAGEGHADGTAIIAFGCKFGQNAANQQFNAGEAMSPLRLALIGMPTAAMTQYNSLYAQNGGSAQLIFDNGMHVVAAGGGNVVAAGGGNVVAAGGGNVVAAGGANVIAPGGGNVIAPGGGNVVAAGGLNLINITDAGVIAPGGGNVVAAGGLNLFGGARVVAAGGGN